MTQSETISPTTNITEAHLAHFRAMTSGEYENFALFSCFLGDEPTCAICAVNQEEGGNYTITPLFIAVTPKMKLTDHDGVGP